jgi:hypothetical protein
MLSQVCLRRAFSVTASSKIRMLEYPIKKLLQQGTDVAAAVSKSYTPHMQYNLRQINSD